MIWMRPYGPIGSHISNRNKNGAKNGAKNQTTGERYFAMYVRDASAHVMLMITLCSGFKTLNPSQGEVIASLEEEEFGDNSQLELSDKVAKLILLQEEKNQAASDENFVRAARVKARMDKIQDTIRKDMADLTLTPTLTL